MYCIYKFAIFMSDRGVYVGHGAWRFTSGQDMSEILTCHPPGKLQGVENWALSQLPTYLTEHRQAEVLSMSYEPSCPGPHPIQTTQVVSFLVRETQR